MTKPVKAKRKPSKVTWWTISIGMSVTYKDQQVLVTYVGRNNGEQTIVHIQLPNVAKARRVRMKELS